MRLNTTKIITKYLNTALGVVDVRKGNGIMKLDPVADQGEEPGREGSSDGLSDKTLQAA